MKTETLAHFQKHLENKRFEITFAKSSLQFDHDFSDDEILEIVSAEYGNSLTQSVSALFEVIVKKLMRTGVEYAKKYI